MVYQYICRESCGSYVEGKKRIVGLEILDDVFAFGRFWHVYAWKDWSVLSRCLTNFKFVFLVHVHHIIKVGIWNLTSTEIKYEYREVRGPIILENDERTYVELVVVVEVFPSFC